MLFAEASRQQVDIINDCLEGFCNSSGKMVSRSKSKDFVSKNVSRSLANAISNSLGF